MSFRLVFVLASLSVCSGKPASADVVFDWATVGNPGNTNDATGLGAVSYEYRISKHEVTNGQYAEFLNKVASVVDTNSLFFSSMRITRSGSGPFSYTANTGFEAKPVAYISFFDAMRFTNWLENGQPAGNQGAGTTETGVYNIGTGVNEVRAPGATYFIPSENEWYKAAYHDPRLAAAFGPPGDDNYWEYPTQNDIPPAAEVPPGGANSGNMDNVGPFGSTNVGAYVGSTSFYGTYDQAGSVEEWTEATVGLTRRMRGGSWNHDPTSSGATSSNLLSPGHTSSRRGFRVASIPEPSAVLYFGVVLLGVSFWRKIRRQTPS